MRNRTWIPLVISTILVGMFWAGVRSGRFPLGVPGEWEWLRVKASPPLTGLLLASTGLAIHVAVAAAGLRFLASRTGAGPIRELVWLSALLASSILVQVAIPVGAADELDLTKWAYVNYFPGSAGYYRIARQQAAADPWKFFADYPDWIRSQDSLHIGTHPPGLIAVQCLLLNLMERNTAAADFLVRHMPRSTTEGFRALDQLDRQGMRRHDRAALYLTALLTLLACGGTVVPLYLVARSGLPAAAAWTAAALWPVASAANLFQPVADTAYPFLSTSALALAAWSSRWALRSTYMPMGSAAFAGAILAFGLAFTLAFVPVGLIVGIVIMATPGLGLHGRLGLVLAVGLGFLGLTALGWASVGANPLSVWDSNLRNHARFYVEYPRTYLAWLMANPIELTIAVGIPTAAWCAVGFAAPRQVPRVAWATFGVLVALNLTGKNMGEVARLWMLFLPPLLPAAGVGFHRLEAGPPSLAYTLALIGLQTLALQSNIQVVYPV